MCNPRDRVGVREVRHQLRILRILGILILHGLLDGLPGHLMQLTEHAEVTNVPHHAIKPVDGVHLALCPNLSVHRTRI